MATPPPPPAERTNATAILVPLLAGIALVLAVTLGWVLLTREDDSTVATTATTPTTGYLTTLPAVSCTGSSPGAVIEDYFEEDTCLSGAYTGIVGDVEVWSDAEAGAFANGSGVGSVTTYEGGLLIVTYPVEVSSGTIRMHFAPAATTPGTRMGIAFLVGDDDDDGIAERFVFVSVVPDSQELVAYAMTAAGEFGTGVAVPLPAPLNPWNEFVVILSADGFAAEINGTRVYTWTAPLPAGSGQVGVGIGGTAGSNERMFVDDFVVSTG